MADLPRRVCGCSSGRPSGLADRRSSRRRLFPLSPRLFFWWHLPFPRVSRAPRGPGENYAVTLLIYVVTACKRRLAVLMRTRDDRGGVRREPADWAPPRRAGAAAAGGVTAPRGSPSSRQFLLRHEAQRHLVPRPDREVDGGLAVGLGVERGREVQGHRRLLREAEQHA